MGCKLNYTDREIIVALIENTPNDPRINDFISNKCRAMLLYISRTIFGNDDFKNLTGEFYMFLSRNNWEVLRKYKELNKASLVSYLSICTFNYFLALYKIEKRYYELITDKLEDICEVFDEEEKDLAHLAVSIAYSQMKEKNRIVLDLLIIEGKSALEAADVLWQYTKKKDIDWRTLPRKYVQDTIAMSKRSACNKLQTLTLVILEQLKGGKGDYIN